MIRRLNETGLVCMRVEDMQATPAAGSTRRPCADCRRDVWVSPASAKAAGVGALIVCQRCFRVRAVAQSGPVQIIKATGEQLDELWEHFRP